MPSPPFSIPVPAPADPKPETAAQTPAQDSTQTSATLPKAPELPALKPWSKPELLAAVNKLDNILLKLQSVRHAPRDAAAILRKKTPVLVDSSSDEEESEDALLVVNRSDLLLGPVQSGNGQAFTTGLTPLPLSQISDLTASQLTVQTPFDPLADTLDAPTTHRSNAGLESQRGADALADAFAITLTTQSSQQSTAADSLGLFSGLQLQKKRRKRFDQPLKRKFIVDGQANVDRLKGFVKDVSGKLISVDQELKGDAFGKIQDYVIERQKAEGDDGKWTKGEDAWRSDMVPLGRADELVFEMVKEAERIKQSVEVGEPGDEDELEDGLKDKEMQDSSDDLFSPASGKAGDSLFSPASATGSDYGNMKQEDSLTQPR